MYLEPLDDYISKYGPKMDVFGMMADTSKIKGKQYGFPVRWGVDIFFYRKDLFQESGLTAPKTLEEYFTAAQKLTKDTNGDGEIDIYGTSLKFASPRWTYNQFEDFFIPFGGNFLTPEGKLDSSVNGQLALNSLKFMKSLQEAKLIPNPFSWHYDDNVVGFQEGRVAMSAEYAPRALSIEDPAKSKVVGKMGYSVLPYTTGGRFPGSVWNLVMNKLSKNKVASYDMLKYFVTPKAQKAAAMETANGPTLLSIYDDPEYRAKNAAASAIQDAMRIGLKIQTLIPKMQDLQLTVHEEVHNLVLGKQDENQTQQNLVKRLKEVLE
jgi:multiple sugar transport system substrate-binding protein